MNEDKALKILAEAFDKAVKEFGEKKLVEAILKQGENIEIKVGQKWHTRCGDIVEIMKDDGSEPRFKGCNGSWYHVDGITSSPNLDLIELVQDENQSTAESLRNRILEIDKERAGLVKKLVELGFTLIGNLEPKDWRKGDVVECVIAADYITKGKMYLISRGENEYGEVVIQKDDDGEVCNRLAKYFKFHHRP